MLKLYQKPSFKKNLKKYKHDKIVLQELEKIIDFLVNEQQIPEKYRNHKLTGNYSGMMELHLKPDDLLVHVKVDGDRITLVAIGSHADLFG